MILINVKRLPVSGECPSLLLSTCVNQFNLLSCCIKYSTPKGNASKLLDHHLQPLLKSEMSCIKDTSDFMLKVKNLNKVPNNATNDVARFSGVWSSVWYEHPNWFRQKAFKILGLFLFASHDIMGCKVFT